MTTKRSQIYGTGYGSEHAWVKGTTAQVGYDAPNKHTNYRCAACGTDFVHWYGAIPNIFEAMRGAGVVERCQGSAKSLRPAE